MRKPLTPLILLALLVIAGACRADDTGTYNIDQYRVDLEPRSDGTVLVNYYQKWSVTGGHIPWVTVGMPNDNFSIEKSGHAVKEIAHDSAGDFTGVRIDLDRDYKPGESFELSFTVVQNGLFYADDKNYKLEFTPGWYDNASTGQLTISVHFFAKIEGITAEPAATSTSGEVMLWERSGLGEGERFDLTITFPKSSLKTAIPADNVQEGLSSGMIALFILIIIVVVIFVFVTARAVGGRSGGGYSGGGIFYGGGGGGRSSGRSSGGGGGFGSRSIGCACACVSCACACACAGGGGAGCSRKARHTCPICREKR